MLLWLGELKLVWRTLGGVGLQLVVMKSLVQLLPALGSGFEAELFDRVIAGGEASEAGLAYLVQQLADG